MVVVGFERADLLCKAKSRCNVTIKRVKCLMKTCFSLCFSVFSCALLPTAKAIIYFLTTLFFSFAATQKQLTAIHSNFLENLSVLPWVVFVTHGIIFLSHDNKVKFTREFTRNAVSYFCNAASYFRNSPHHYFYSRHSESNAGGEHKNAVVCAHKRRENLHKIALLCRFCAIFGE